MRSKTLVSIVAFITAFGISVALAPQQTMPTVAPFVTKGCAETEIARKITSLLSQDIENGRVRDRKVNRFRKSESAYSSADRISNFALATDEYAKTSASIDDSSLPFDFQIAWRAHLQVWQIHAEYLNDVSVSSADFSPTVYSEQNKEISETWFEVLRVAKRYDANIPAGAY